MLTKLMAGPFEFEGEVQRALMLAGALLVRGAQTGLKEGHVDAGPGGGFGGTRGRGIHIPT